MEVWASRYGKQVQFLMVCVDAAGLLRFHHLQTYFLILVRAKLIQIDLSRGGNSVWKDVRVEECGQLLDS